MRLGRSPRGADLRGDRGRDRGKLEEPSDRADSCGTRVGTRPVLNRVIRAEHIPLPGGSADLLHPRGQVCRVWPGRELLRCTAGATAPQAAG